MPNDPQYLRKYRVLVSDKTGTTLDVSELRCTWVVEKKALQAVNYADISVYNLTGATEAAIIREGHKVIVEAGYENSAYGRIFDGDLFQPMWDRENVVDYKLMLHCIDGDSLLHQNFANFSLASGYDYKSIITAMAQKARTKIPIGVISEGIDRKKSPRGKVMFGDPRETFRNIARDNNAQFYINDGQLNIMKITDVPRGQALVISPQTGLIGTPQQIDYGFSFRCLMNPNIRITNPCMMVKLENTVIRQQKAIQGQIVSMLDQDMYGIVIGLKHTGDTRGGEWYTDVTCVTSGGKVPLPLAGLNIPGMLSEPGGNPN